MKESAGAGPADWNTAATWSPSGVPTAADSVVIKSGHTITLNVSGTCGALNVIGTLTYPSGPGTVNRTLTVTTSAGLSGDVTISGTFTFAASNGQRLTLAGNFTCTGTFNNSSGNNGSVIFNGTGVKTISTTAELKTIEVNNSSLTLQAAGSFSLTAKLTVSAGTFDPNGNLITGSGTNTLSVSGSTSTLKVDASTFAGNYTSWETRTLGANSTVNYSGTTQTVDNTLSYIDLIISGSGTKTFGGNTTITGNLSVNSGTLDLSTFTADRSASGGTITVASGATLKIGGTNSFPSNYTAHSLGITSTVEYSGSNQTVSLESYGNLTLSGSGTKTMLSSAMTIAGNFTMSGTASATAGDALTVNGNVSLGASTTLDGSSFAHSVAGNWTSDGTFTGSTSTVTLSGTNASISGSGSNNFNNLTITGNGITTDATTNLTITGDFSTTGAGTFTHTSGGTGTVTMSGPSKTISGTGISFNNLTLSGSISTTSSFTIAGNLSVSGSLFATSGTMTMSGSSKTISGVGTIAFNALDIKGTISTSNSFSLTFNLSVTGSLTATAGTATFAGTSTLSGTANLFNVELNGTSLQLGTTSVLGIAGTFTLTSGTFDVTTTSPNTVNYNGSGVQTVASTTYSNLSFSGGGTKTAGGPLTINNDLTINSGPTLSAGSFTHTLYGNWNNSGSFTAGSSTIQTLGSADVSITGATTFNTLTINKDGALNVVTLNNDISTATFNMTTGKMLTGSNKVTVTSDRTGDGIIIGTITRTHTFINGTAYAFEGPDNLIKFTGGGTPSSITVTVGLAGPSDFDPVGVTINRTYTISQTGGSGYTATLRLHYEDIELNGNVENDMQMWRFDGGVWTNSSKTSNDATANWVEKTGESDITTRWTLLAPVSGVLDWNGSVSSAWETAANWTTVSGSPNIPPIALEVVRFGFTAFTNDPTVTAAATIRSFQMGSAQAVTVTLSGAGVTVNGSTGNLGGFFTSDVTHTINVNGQTLDVGGDLTLSDGTLNRRVNITVGSGTVIVRGALNHLGNSSISFSGAGNISVKGNWNIGGSASFYAGTSTATYDGSGSQTVAGGITYNDLTFNKSGGTARLSASTTVNGNLTLSTAGTFQVNAPLIVAGNVTINTGTTVNGNSTTISVGGNWTRSGTFIASAGTVQFNGSGSQFIDTSSFNNLTINKSGTATPTGNLGINGNLTVSGGTFDLSTFKANRNAPGGSLTLGAGTTLKIGTGSNYPANFTTNSLSSSSTVEYNGTGTQTVAAVTYGNLTLSNGGSNAKTLAGSATVANDLLINSGATLDASSFSLNVAGNWTNNGTFTPSLSSVTLSGIGKTLSGSTTFNNLTISSSYTGLSDIVVNSTMNVIGTYAAGGTTTTFSGNFSNTGTLTSSGTVTFSGSSAQTIAMNSGFNSSGTVNFNGTVAPAFTDVTSPTLTNVNINNTGGITPVTAWTVGGTFTIASGATFSGGALSHTFNSTFTNNGTVSSSGTLLFSPSSFATLTLLGTAFSSTGTVEFGGSGLITIAGGTPSFNSVNITNTNSSGVTPATNWSLTGNLFIGGGATFNGGSSLSHTITGNFTNSGTFDGGTSTVTMDNTVSATIGGGGTTTFNNLTIATGAVIGAATSFNVSGNFVYNGTFDGTAITVSFTGSSPSTISGTTTPALFDLLTIAKSSATTTLAVNLTGLTALTISSGTLDASTFTITQNSLGGTLTVSADATLKIGGTNTLPTFNTYSFDAASTVDYAGANQTVSAQSYGNLSLGNTGTKTFAAGTTGIAETFTISVTATADATTNSTTLDYNGSGAQTIRAINYNNLTISGARTTNNVTLASSETIGVAGTFTASATFTSGVYVITGSTIDNNGSAQTLASFTYNNLTTSGSGTKTAGGAITVEGTLTLSAGSFADGGFTITSKGNVANSVAHTGAGKILFTGGSTAHTLSGSGSYTNVELNDANGATLSANLTINGTLTLTSGNITTSSNTVIISSSGSISRTSGHVVGNLQKNVATGASVSRTFEIGTGTNYTPVDVTLASVSTAGDLTATTVASEHSNISTSGINASKSVNRYWTLTNSGAVFTNYDATLNFVAGDVDGGASTANFIVKRFSSSTWFSTTTGTRTSTSTQATGITGFGDFAVGELIAVLTWDGGAVTNNWGDALNWSSDNVPTSSDDVSLTGADTINVNVAANCNNLTLNNASLTVTILSGVGQPLTVSGNLTLTTGTLNAEADFPSVSGTTNLNGGTVGYTGSAVQTVAAVTYYHLAFSNGGAKSINSTLTVNGDVTINSGAPVTVGGSVILQVNGNMNVSGAVTNNGTINVGN